MISPSREQLARIADTAWQQQLAREPLLRLREGLPIERLPQRSLEEAQANAAAARARLAELRGVDTQTLTQRERLTHAFLAFTAELESDEEAFWWEQWSVAPYSSFEFSLNVGHIFAPYAFESLADGERYVQLLHDYRTAVHEAADKLSQQAGRGWRVPRPALPGIRKTWAGYRQMAAALVPVPERLGKLPDAAALRARILALVNNEITPAFSRILEILGSEYEAHAPAEPGIGRQPGGEAAYQRWLRLHLTFTADAAGLHQLGREEVRMLQARMDEVRRKHFRFDGDEAEFHARLHADPRCHARDAAQVEATYRGHLARIAPLLPQWFARLPQAPFDVQRLAPELEPGMSYGYYDPPTVPGKPGIYRYNGSNLDTRMQLNAAPLIFHELAPGHHFHLARQAENDSLPALRRHAISFSCFNEGWAEYSAGLAEEMGLYEDPYDLYGWLSHQRFVAQRLVVDTGMNALGWTLQQGRDYMQAHTLESAAQIATDTLRYASDLPAQALAYRMGFLRIRELRERARHKLGAAFDIRRYHEAILGEGALPLAVLEQSIEQWSDQELRNAQGA